MANGNNDLAPTQLADVAPDLLNPLFPATTAPAGPLAPTGVRTVHGAGPVAYAPLIQRYAQQYGVPPELLTALIHAESGFSPRAVSRAGAQGLTQLEPGTARDMGVSDPFDPEQNIMGGARYLRQMYDQTGSWTRALSAYNRGPEGAQKTGYSLAGYQGYGAGNNLIALAHTLDSGGHVQAAVTDAGPADIPPPYVSAPEGFGTGLTPTSPQHLGPRVPPAAMYGAEPPFGMLAGGAAYQAPGANPVISPQAFGDQGLVSGGATSAAVASQALAGAGGPLTSQGSQESQTPSGGGASGHTPLYQPPQGMDMQGIAMLSLLSGLARGLPVASVPLSYNPWAIAREFRSPTNEPDIWRAGYPVRRIVGPRVI